VLLLLCCSAALLLLEIQAFTASIQISIVLQ
jgi:hypothetical protein